MLNWIRSTLGRQKDTESKCLPMNESEWLNSPNSADDSTVSNLVSEYSNNKKLTQTQLATIRTRFNTWEKEVGFWRKMSIKILITPLTQTVMV